MFFTSHEKIKHAHPVISRCPQNQGERASFRKTGSRKRERRRAGTICCSKTVTVCMQRPLHLIKNRRPIVLCVSVETSRYLNLKFWNRNRNRSGEVQPPMVPRLTHSSQVRKHTVCLWCTLHSAEENQLLVNRCSIIDTEEHVEDHSIAFRQCNLVVRRQRKCKAEGPKYLEF